MEPLDLAQRGLSTLAFLQLRGVNGPRSQALLTWNTTLQVPGPPNSLPQRPNWSPLQSLHWLLPGLSSQEQTGLKVVQGWLHWKLVKNGKTDFIWTTVIEERGFSVELSSTSTLIPSPLEEEKMGVSPAADLLDWKARFEGLREDESASEGESSPFSFHPMPSPKENYGLWQARMLVLNICCSYLVWTRALHIEIKLWCLYVKVER